MGLKEQYRSEVAPQLQKRFNYSSIMEAPKLEKIVVNTGIGLSRARGAGSNGDNSFVSLFLFQLSSVI